MRCQNILLPGTLYMTFSTRPIIRRMKNNLKKLRKLAGLTQAQLAERAALIHPSLEKLSWNTVGRIENAQLPFDEKYLVAFSQVLKCSMADLIEEKIEDKPSIPAVIPYNDEMMSISIVCILNILKKLRISKTTNEQIGRYCAQLYELAMEDLRDNDTEPDPVRLAKKAAILLKTRKNVA